MTFCVGSGWVKFNCIFHLLNVVSRGNFEVESEGENGKLKDSDTVNGFCVFSSTPKWSQNQIKILSCLVNESQNSTATLTMFLLLLPENFMFCFYYETRHRINLTMFQRLRLLHIRQTLSRSTIFLWLKRFKGGTTQNWKKKSLVPRDTLDSSQQQSTPVIT